MPRRPQARATTRVPRRIGRRVNAYVAYGREVCRAEAAAIAAMSRRLGDGFAAAVDAILGASGRVVVTGIGKSGFVAQKLSATLASTGTPSLYLHPAEALHGDLGRVALGDVLLALSYSGGTEEVVRLIAPVRRLGAKVVAITGHADSPLGRAADVVLDIGQVEEAGPLGLAPTTSAAMLLSVGDALAMTVLDNRRFTPDEYALRHPGGQLGKNALRVGELMRRGEANPVVAKDAPLKAVVVAMTNTPGHPGCASVVDAKGRLAGIFTDGDLRRLVERGHIDFEAPIGGLMGKNPRTCRPDDRAMDAARTMRDARVDQLPVVDEAGRPVGLLDVQDLLATRTL